MKEGGWTPNPLMDGPGMQPEPRIRCLDTSRYRSHQCPCLRVLWGCRGTGHGPAEYHICWSAEKPQKASNRPSPRWTWELALERGWSTSPCLAHVILPHLLHHFSSISHLCCSSASFTLSSPVLFPPPKAVPGLWLCSMTLPSCRCRHRGCRDVCCVDPVLPPWARDQVPSYPCFHHWKHHWISQQGTSPRIQTVRETRCSTNTDLKSRGVKAAEEVILHVNVILNLVSLRIRSTGVPALETLLFCSI